jgi:uncharacterized membrane protein HdeD (DUF308 family)
MSDRLLIPFAIPLTLAFIGGVIVSVLQLSHGATVTLGIVCGLVSLLSGVLSAVRANTTSEERKMVGLLRAGLGLGLFVFLYLATLSLLRDGKIVLAVIFLILAGVCAGLLSRMQMLTRRDLRGQGFAEFHKRRAGNA